jgi:uncharacterized membrane protein YecN with MAPEG domain
LTTVGAPVGVFVAFTVWLAVAQALPDTGAPDSAQRLGQACIALLPMCCVLNAMIVLQMSQRVLSGAVDPLAGNDGRVLRMNQRALSNTVEQLAGFVPALLALAARIPAGSMRYVVAAALTFAAARLVFWAGYALGPLTRAPGMAATFAVNIGTLLAAILVWLVPR